MEPLPVASNAWPTLQTLLLVSQTIILLIFLAFHHSQREDQIPQPLLQAIQDAVGEVTATRTPSTQALVEKAQQLVTELNSLLVSIDSHHEEILQLRHQIQLVDQRISGHPSQNSSTTALADHKLHNLPASVPLDHGVGEASRGSRRDSGKRSHSKRSSETVNPGDDGGSADLEANGREPERRPRGGRRHKQQDQDLDTQ